MSAGSQTPMSGWQRANVLAAAKYLRAIASRSPSDVKVQVVYQGLLEVLEPARRNVRQQRELSDAARSCVTLRERRAGRDRRSSDRRRTNRAPNGTPERRSTDRRSGGDRRGRV